MQIVGVLLGLVLLIYGLRKYLDQGSTGYVSPGRLIFGFLSPYVGLWLLIISSLSWLVERQMISRDVFGPQSGVTIGLIIGLLSGWFWFWSSKHIAKEPDERMGAIIGGCLSIIINLVVGAAVGAILVRLYG